MRLKLRTSLQLPTLITCLAALPACVSNPGSPQNEPVFTWPAVTSAIAKNQETELAIQKLISRMSLEQKVGQMMQPEIRQVTPEEVKRYHVGAILNGGGAFPNNNKHSSVADWVVLADAFYQASIDTSDGGLAIPVIWGTDAVHGNNNVVGATLFPHNIGLGATRNPELIKQIGEITAKEVAATGIDWVFSPTVAAPRNDLWGRTYEGYSEDPEIIKMFARKMVQGLQGSGGSDSLFDDAHVVATVKHFIGDGGTQNGADRGNNIDTEEQLRDIHGQGYFSALEAGAQTVMASFNSWHGKKMHGNQYLLNDVLKQQMGFDGFVVGDWNGHSFVNGCTPTRCSQAINAGIDLLMAPNKDWTELYHNTIKQVESGEIAISRIDDAVTRILRVKMRAGLFNRGAPSTRRFTQRSEVLGSPEHRSVARQAVRESLVLLKNKRSILPLDRNLRILVAGDGADNIAKQSGGWTLSWQGRDNTNADFPGATSIFSGIRAAVKDSGGTATLSTDGTFDNRPDVAIVVFGENPYAEADGDRGTLQYQPGSHLDLQLLQTLKNQGIPIVSIFLSGRPLIINRELEASDAFVAAWLPGSEGAGIADVIFKNSQGEINYDFVGKLGFSWPKYLEQTNLNRHDELYQALFPYGFGLKLNNNKSGSLAIETP